MVLFSEGGMSTDRFELNFAVPSLNSLRGVSQKYDLDASRPGFLEEALTLFADMHQFKDIKLAFDGKKLSYGIGKKLGEEDLCGHEASPTLGMKRSKLKLNGKPGK